MLKPKISLYCENEKLLSTFLNKYYNKDIPNTMEDISFDNPIELVDIISVVIDNTDKYPIAAWINLDEDIYIKITSSNINEIIKYLYERYPY